MQTNTTPQCCNKCERVDLVIGGIPPRVVRCAHSACECHTPKATTSFQDSGGTMGGPSPINSDGGVTVLKQATTSACDKCKGTGWYQYSGFTRGTPHSKVCEFCCKHEGEAWKHQDGKYYCKAGCGEEIKVPTSAWEEEFNASFVDSPSGEILVYEDGRETVSELKSFIRKVEADARKKELEEAIQIAAVSMPNLSEYEGSQLRFWQGFRKGVESVIQDLQARINKDV